MMAITQATDCGLLPRDPGTPWRAAPTRAELEDRRAVSELEAAHALRVEELEAEIHVRGEYEPDEPAFLSELFRGRA